MYTSDPKQQNSLSEVSPALKSKPFSRRQFGFGMRVLLAVMQIYVIIAIALVVYAFVQALHQH